jgi:ribonuclease BN (tRNA processing enzyme)
MPLTLTSLGSSAALPLKESYFTAHVLNVRGRLFLLDCGEGTQLRLRQLGISLGAIDNIFLTHLHGDHVFGIFGLLSSMHLLERTAPVHIFAPGGFEKMLEFYFSRFVNGPLPSGYTSSISGTGPLASRRRTYSRCLFPPVLHHSGPATLFVQEKKVRRSETGSVAYCTDTAPVADLPAWITASISFFMKPPFWSRINVPQKYLHSTAADAAAVRWSRERTGWL